MKDPPPAVAESPAGRRLRVMQVTHDLGIGGLPRVVVTLARTLDRRRFDVSVLCMNEKGALAEELEADGIPVLQVPSPRHPDYLALFRVARILRRVRVDVLHTHNTQPFIEAGPAALITGTRTIVHTDHGREWPDLRRYMWAERVMSRFAYRVVGVSEETSHQLIEFEHLDPTKVLTIPNGIDPTPFDTGAGRDHARATLNLPPRAPIVCTVARLTPEKGVDLLLEAMPAVLREVPDCLCLVVGYGVMEEQLKARASELKVDGRVRFLGRRRDVPLILLAADCYALPSRREGLPMAILEAMAARLPVVATRVGGVPSVVRDGETGTLVEPEDPSALAAGLIRLLGDRSLREAYGAEARTRFELEFSARAMTERYERLYLRRAGEASGGSTQQRSGFGRHEPEEVA